MASAVQHVDPEQVKRAAAALLRHLQEQESRKTQQLIEEDEMISLIVTMKQIPTERKAKPVIIPLAHSIAPETQEICVFTKDPQDEYKAKLLEVDSVRKVIGLTKLRKNYKTFEAKRKLVASYDLFLTDDRIVTFMPALLGKAFYEKKRNPIPISLTKTNIGDQIRKVQKSTFMFLTTGACMNVKIGRSTFSAEQVAENVMAALPKIVERLPKKWANVQALHIKSTSSISLPIYNSLPDAAAASTHNVQTEKRKLPEPDSAPAGKASGANGTPKKARTAPAAAEAPQSAAKPRVATPPQSATKSRVGTPRPALKAGTPKRVATPK